MDRWRDRGREGGQVDKPESKTIKYVTTVLVFIKNKVLIVRLGKEMITITKNPV